MEQLDTTFTVLCILSYLLGSIPTGLIIGKINGKDIRKVGSGNIGTTNAFRALGKVWGIVTFLGDTLKGVPFMYIANSLNYTVKEQAILGFLAFLGHCYSPYLKFSGGKGVATAFAIFIFLAPTNALIAFLIFIFVFFFSGIISISSLLSSLSLIVSSSILITDKSILLLAIIVTGIIWLKHKPNIQRLLKGEESYFNFGLRKILKGRAC